MTPVDYALAYATLGLNVVPIPTGCKYPKGINNWEKLATTDPQRICRYWAKHPSHGVGIATGPASGIFVVDIDPRDGGDDSLKALETKYGPLPETVETLTGGGGRHIYFQWPATGEIHNSASGVLGVGIDVRGIDGQVLAPPTIHPTTGTPYVFEIVHDLLDGQEVAAAPDWLIRILQTPPAGSEPRRERLPRLGDLPGDIWAASTTWAEQLERYGASLHSHHADAGGSGYEMWTRPGKDKREGASSSLYYKGSDVLKVFTPNWPGLVNGETYTLWGYHVTLEHSGDYGKAARIHGRDQRAERAETPPGNVDPDTGEIHDSTHLPEEFWAARPVLQHIRQAAWSRSRSGDAYLAAVLARIAAITHPSIRLPAIVAAPAPLTFYVSLVGRSGGGKSSTVTGATELLPYEGTQVADNMPLGSGEGLIELFYDMVMEEDANGKMKPVKRQTRHGAFVYLDEGQALAELGNRKGSTLLPMLRTAWSGVVLGTSNASAETKRKLPAGSYAIGLVIAFQPSKAAELLADTAGGTPQRFEWIEGTDPNVPDELPEWPGPIEWQQPAIYEFGTNIMTVPESIAAPIRKNAIKLTRGQIQPDELDSHATLAMMKVAGLLAVLDGRTDITEEDWHLATMFQKTSHRVRANVLAAVAIEQRKAEEFATARYVGRESAVADSQVAKATHRMARAIGRHVHKAACEGGCKLRCVTRATSSGDRALTTVADAIDHAIGLHWIATVDDLILPGEARPT